MKLLEARKIDPQISFDLPTYMALAQTGDLEGPEVADMLNYWEKWRPALSIYIFGRKKGYLAVFMDRSVEEKIDEIWPDSPSKGFKLQALVQTMITCALQELIPSIGRDQCAPVPKPNKILKRSLARVGLDFSNQGTLNYKYSTLTFYPYKNGCQVCYLAPTCPKLNLPRMEGLFNPPS